MANRNPKVGKIDLLKLLAVIVYRHALFGIRHARLVARREVRIGDELVLDSRVKITVGVHSEIEA